MVECAAADFHCILWMLSSPFSSQLAASLLAD